LWTLRAARAEEVLADLEQPLEVVDLVTKLGDLEDRLLGQG
jgi:hypothetical protein